MKGARELTARTKTRLALAMGILCAISVEGQDWGAADRATKRLSPSVFTNAPAAVRAEMERRGCTVPQPFTASQPENVIQGRFFSAGQMDWAVLCSRRRVSSILIFRNGTASSVIEIASRADSSFLQGIGSGEIGFSRGIHTASPRSIRAYHDAFGGQQLPPIDHDGIDDAFIEKASVVRYWYGGRWLSLQGAD